MIWTLWPQLTDFQVALIGLFLWGAFGAGLRFVYEWPEKHDLPRFIARALLGSFMSLQAAFLVWYWLFTERPLWLFFLGGMSGLFGMDAVPILFKLFQVQTGVHLGRRNEDDGD